MILIDTGYKDKKGQKIYLDQFAEVFDRHKNRWIGKISTYEGKCINNGIFVTRVFVFESNMITWLHSYWTEKSLRIVEPSKEIIKLYEFQKKLPWGYYYTLKQKKNYYK
ncbi:MAG: hypothetical protein ACWGNI_00190 [Desulfobacterales bacterium]